MHVKLITCTNIFYARGCALLLKKRKKFNDDDEDYNDKKEDAQGCHESSCNLVLELGFGLYLFICLFIEAWFS